MSSRCNVQTPCRMWRTCAAWHRCECGGAPLNFAANLNLSPERFKSKSLFGFRLVFWVEEAKWIKGSGRRAHKGFKWKNNWCFRLIMQMATLELNSRGVYARFVF